MSGLIWVQTVCKGYQQTTQVGKELIMWHNLTYDIVLWAEGFHNSLIPVTSKPLNNNLQKINFLEVSLECYCIFI